MLEKISAIASKGREVSIDEALKETRIKNIEESPIQDSMVAIENSSLESLKAQNELILEKINVERIGQIEKNRENGANRENLAYKELQQDFPENEGYKVEREQCLRIKKVTL